MKHILLGASLVAALATSGLTALVQAAETDANGNYLPRIGSKAPARYNGGGLTDRQLTSAGLPAPLPCHRWVQIGDKYVQIQISDGTVQSVEPTVK